MQMRAYVCVCVHWDRTVLDSRGWVYRWRHQHRLCQEPKNAHQQKCGTRDILLVALIYVYITSFSVLDHSSLSQSLRVSLASINTPFLALKKDFRLAYFLLASIKKFD